MNALNPRLATRDGEDASLQREQEYERLYRARQWFGLRDAVNGNDCHPFYGDVIACIFDCLHEDQSCFRATLQSAGHTRQQYEAHRLLSWMHIRKAEFKLALPHLEAMAAYRPESRSLRAGQNLFAHFAGYPQQTVDRFRPSTLAYAMVEGNLFVPAKIHGETAECMIDSGAGISLITESEAKRLGIEIHSAKVDGPRMYAAIGSQTNYRVGIASQLEIGEFRIANVAFLVLQDHQLQFSGGRQLALGLPVLLAFRTLAWRADGKLSIGLPGGKRDLSQANLCFDSGDLVVEVSIGGKKMIFLVDTGSGATLLWPLFAKDLPQVVRQSGASGSTPLHGVSGTAEIGSITLPSLKLEIAGFVAELRPAYVLTEPTTPNSRWLFGRLGLDVLNQADSVLLDFQAMRLSLNCVSL